MTAIDLPLFVDGAETTTGEWIERENPTHPKEIVGRVASASPDVVERAVLGAAKAFEPWRNEPLEARTTALLAATEALEVEQEELAVLLTRELGKILPDTRGEIGFAHAFVTYCGGVAPKSLADESLEDDQGRLMVTREPFGPIAAITPWNAPIILTMLKVGPALLAGNTMIVKPSPLAPLAITRVLTTIARALPPGVLNVVHGDAEVGRALTSHSLIAKIAFTGGLPTARHILAVAAEGVTPTVMELGGNDAAIFLDDAVIDDVTVERAIHGTFLTSGQVCMAAKRLYVHASIIDEFVDRYVEVAQSALIVGDPLNDGVTVGPVNNARQQAFVEELLADARRGGADVVRIGRVPDKGLMREGYFVHPALVTGATDDSRIVREEQFGPAVPVLAFDSDDEVVARANDSEFGLASSVWSQDETRAFELSRRLQTGYTFVNTHNRSGMSFRAPFGGMKMSGFGREFSADGILEYVQTHAINLPAAFRQGGSGSGSAYPGQ